VSLVSLHNEWDPLEEMIVGIADNARIPSAEPGLFAVDYADIYDSPDEVPSGPYDARVIEETAEDLQIFADFLTANGVTVRRPVPTDHAARFSTPDWTADGESNYCPRDVLLTVGDKIIETPMVLRTRYFEPFAYKELLLEYFASGANWISAPKPRLADGTYRLRPPDGQVLTELEPLFDAANVLRAGRDLLYLVSSSGNRLGAEWLQRVLGDEYTVHPLEGVYSGTHIDTTIALIRPGLMVLNSARVRPDDLPPPFKKWDVISCPPLPDNDPEAPWLRATTWISMNLIMVNPGLAVVDPSHRPLIAELERHGIEVAPLRLRHSRRLSGGFHCVSLDVRRSGILEDYGS
jgi:N-dimethylarginine dimethylaminohydrolase